MFVLGWVLVPVGVAGVFLPLLPGTVFLILAAACFARSSPRFETWLVSHPRLGPPIRSWRATGAIPRRAKWIACTSLALSWIVILDSNAPNLVKAGCLALFLGVGWYILNTPDT